MELIVADYHSLIGQELVSGWNELSQTTVNQFADVIDDHQFIHIDPARAASETPFGGTIAHGFLTLSWLTKLGNEVMPALEANEVMINYGFDKVRFVNPVRTGSKIRGHFTLSKVENKSGGELLTYQTTVEIEGQEKPALIAEWLLLIVAK
ncbi:MaoC family dehydratase [Microvirga sp. W0021]|uniref:MaoC family dehydratase n=1 Tax=Hohaiivirga grylli TaxID=3133970 RepID=A0ABV0BHS1_9HYPH